jgi:multidrug efflux pump
MGLPGVSAFPITPPSLGQGFRERSINYVSSPATATRTWQRVSQQLMAEMAKNPGFVQPDTDLRAEQARDLRRGGPCARRRHGRQRRSAVARTVETMLGGRAVTRYKRDADQYDVIVQTEMRPAAPRRRTSTSCSCAAAATRWCR